MGVVMGDRERRPGEGSSLPAERPADGGGVVGRHMEGIEATMKLQAEILKRLHDQQEDMGKALKDSSRSEMMIQSTRSLNDSFSGMKRVQETLIDRLGSNEGRRKWMAVGLLLGCAVIAGAVIWGVDALGEQVEATGRRLEKPNADPVADAAFTEIQEMRDRLEQMEGRDQAMFLDRLDKLQDQVQRLQAERLQVERDRDRAREELGAGKADRLRVGEERDEARDELDVSRKAMARLVTQALADQRLLSELNDVIATLKRGGVGAAVRAESAPPAVKPATTATDTAGAGEVAVAAGEAAGDPPDAPKPAAVRVVTPTFLSDLNRLLARHRGGESYTLVTASSFDTDGLYEVVLEVRGRDGSLAKTVRAEKMGFELAAAGGFLEMGFEIGHIEFRHGISRTVKSPFFNDRYQIVVLGVGQQDWLGAKLAFLKVK